MKKVAWIILLMLCVFVLSACGCNHDWEEATCTDAKTCRTCGETEGDVMGHTWVEATCTTAKTCSNCGETEGKALGHSWIDATTEAPKTCETCHATEGEPLATDPRFSTSACADLFGSWQGQITLPAEAIGLTDTDLTVVYDCVFTYSNTGEVSQSIRFADWDSLRPILRQRCADELYAQGAALGMDQDATKALVEERSGVTMDAYLDMYADSIGPDLGSVDMVYYVDGSNLYIGSDWDQMEGAYMYSLEGDKLILISLPDLEKTELTRVAE